MNRLLAATLFASLFAVHAFAQLAPTITKSFNPSTVVLGNNSDATITVTNPNAFPINNIQFSDTMPAGINLITQIGGTCSTPATGGGMFSINPGTENFSSTSTVLAAGQSCDIIVRVQGTVLGAHLNTTSQVTATGVPAGGPASATLTVIGPAADVSISGSVAGPATAQLPVTITLTVTNGGPETASAVTVVDTLPAGATLNSATPSQGSCSGTGPVTCNLGSLTNGATATISLSITPTVSGPNTNTATVSTSATDTNTANNTAIQNFDVASAGSIPTLSTMMLALLGATLVAIALLRSA